MPGRKNKFQKEHPMRADYVLLNNSGFFTSTSTSKIRRRRESIDIEYARLVAEKDGLGQGSEKILASNGLKDATNELVEKIDDVATEHSASKLESHMITPQDETFESVDASGDITSTEQQIPEANPIGEASEALETYGSYEYGSGTNFDMVHEAVTPVAVMDGTWNEEPEVSPSADDGLGSWSTIPVRVKRAAKTSNTNNSRGCFNCGVEGHMKNECPEPPKSNPCFNCGHEGHMKNECTEPPKPREKTCRKCGESTHLARDCPNAESGDGLEGNDGYDVSDRECYNCGELGHLSRDCPTKQNGGGGGSGGGGNHTCYSCGEEGHFSRECPLKGSGGQGLEPRACYKCGEEGHISRNCPSMAGSQGRGQGCFTCGEEGHISRHCPHGKSQNSGGGNVACFDFGNGHSSNDTPEVALGHGMGSAWGSNWENSDMNALASNQAGGNWADDEETTVANGGDDGGIKW